MEDTTTNTLVKGVMLMNRNYKKIAALMLCSGLVLTACGGGNNAKESNSSNGGTNSTAKTTAAPADVLDAKAKISWLNILQTSTTPTGPILEKLKN